jgi:hypothetical protein
MGKKALNRKAMGKIISLLRKDPFAMAHKTGSSREEINPEAFSALTAKSSPKIPAVFLAANLLITATSSIIAAISSNSAKKPDAIVIVLDTALNYFVEQNAVLAPCCLFLRI